MSINKLNFQEKQTGDTLAASEWNQTVNKIDELVDTSNNGGNGGVVSIIDDTVSDPSAGVNIATGVTNVGTVKVMELTKKKKGVNTTLVSQNNINIEPRESVDDTKGGNISFKPGDDIEFCSHHRLADNQDEVSIKVIDGDDNPVKLQLNAAEMTLTTKDKTGDNANVFDINVNSGKNTKGYLKVRAQAIDLRCEDHGGIALQPKGEDSDHHMNKIKFEHGGGDGLEFGTFNTEHTSLFTEDYRFNKDGIIKLATRQIEVSDKADPNDPTTAYKYVKNTDDDFYDFIRSGDPSCTWADIVSYISWLKSTHQGIFQAGLILSTGLANSEDGLPQIKILCGSNKSVTAQKIVDRASNITTTINGTTYNLTATLYGSQLRFTTQYNNHEVVVFMQQNLTSGTQNLPEGLKLYTFSLSYDPVSSLNASTAKLTIGNFDFVGLF